MLTCRCKMYQRWAIFRTSHRHVLAALFGRCAWEGADTCRNGVVWPRANIHARRFQDDMKRCYSLVGDFQVVSSLLQHRSVKLFEEGQDDATEQLLLIDFSCIRMAKLGKAIPPPGQRSVEFDTGSRRVDVNIESQPATTDGYKCIMICANGRSCDTVWSTKQRLLVH